MSDPAQVEADALLARRLQEEEYMAANVTMPNESFGMPPHQGMSPDGNSHRPSNFHRPPGPQGVPRRENNLDSAFTSLLEHVMGHVQTPRESGPRQDFRDSFMHGPDSWSFSSTQRNSAHSGADFPGSNPHASQNNRGNFREETYDNLPDFLESHMHGSRGFRPSSDGHRTPSSQQPPSRPRSGATFTSGSFGPQTRSNTRERNEFDNPMFGDMPSSVRSFIQTMLGGQGGQGGQGGRRDGPNDGGSNESGPGQFMGSSMMFGMGGDPFGSGGATFVSGSTATAGPGGATASAQSGTFPRRPSRGQTFTFATSPEDFVTFFRQNMFSGPGAPEGGGTDDVFNFLRSHFFTNGEVPDSYEDFINIMERMGTVNRSATDEEIDSLPSHQFADKSNGKNSAKAQAGSSSTSNGDNAEQDDKCAICLGDYEQDEEVKNMPCGHQFHSECLGRWLKINRTCPICKQSLRQGDNSSD